MKATGLKISNIFKIPSSRHLQVQIHFLRFQNFLDLEDKVQFKGDKMLRIRWDKGWEQKSSQAVMCLWYLVIIYLLESIFK
jgi:hypothetical protein